MSKYFSDQNLHIITNIISGIETYGQRYSDERNWGDFTQAYANTKNQVSITIGWGAHYGDQARKLLQMIQTDYPEDFKKNDTANIAADIKKSFVKKPYYQPKKTSNKAKSIIAIITSQGGKKSQDKLFGELIEKYLTHAIDFGINKDNIKALMMWCQIQHVGGLGPVKRIFKRCGNNPTLDQIMAALKKDQQNGNTAEVGDKIYNSRHRCCYDWINKYVKDQTPAAQQKEEIKVSIDFSKYYGKISNCSSDERKKYSGGKAGDQTGSEWTIRTWYNRPWSCVLRHPDQTVRQTIAELGIKAANNNNIGYDQGQRDTYWNQLKKCLYDPSNIKTKCEADCSAGVIANTRAAGYILNIPALKNLSASYTGDMKFGFKKAGFEVLTAKKYLTGYDYLMPGDILLYENHHTATNLGIGNKVKYATTKVEKEQQTRKVTLNKTKQADGIVTAEALYVRQWAGSENNPLVSVPVVNKGKKVEIYDTIKDSKGNDWYYIKVNGKFGFSSAKYINKI